MRGTLTAAKTPTASTTERQKYFHSPIIKHLMVIDCTAMIFTKDFTKRLSLHSENNTAVMNKKKIINGKPRQ